jgi:hypothetical protein
MDKSRKMEGSYHGQRRTTWFLWKEGVKPSDIYRWLSEICEEKAPARSNVFNWVRRFNIGKETAQTGLSPGRLTPSLTSATVQTITEFIMVDIRITLMSCRVK